MTDTEDAAKSNEQTINQIAAVIKLDISSKSAQESENSTKTSDTIIEAANKPPIKTRICYSVNQIEGLQMLGNYTFVAQYETNEFIQKIVGLLKKPDTTEISRLPTPWREKFKCLSLDANDFLYKDELLVFPKALRLVFIRSLDYGHPGRDTMLATVSIVWWPRFHREVVSLPKTCSQCQQAGKNIKTVIKQKQIGTFKYVLKVIKKLL